jgi:hypothetical protein
MILLMLLQNADDVQKIITTNDATVQGILIGICLALGASTIYLYKENKRMQAEIIKELKEFNSSLIRINKQYDDFVTNFEKYRMKDV